MRKVFNFIAGVMAGAILGSVAALLLAPESGGELQERIRARGQQLIEEARKAAAAQRAEMEAQLDSFKRGSPVAIGSAPEQLEA
jgi:gas vesicle protein